MITHDTPNSSNIARLKYNHDTAELDIEFRSGRTYRYFEVPTEIWDAFTSAESAGRFLNNNIKGKYKEKAL